MHIHADKLPRQQWKIEKVRLKRPIQKLYPLETSAHDENNIAVRAVVGSGTNIQMVRDEDVPVVVTAP